MARSVILEVRRALVTGITQALADSDTDFSGVSVTYAWEGAKDDSRREQVFTNNARATHDPAALKAGRNFRNEDMTFDVVVLVIGVGLPPDETDARALDIGEVVEEFIADRKSNELGVTGLNWIRVADFASQNLTHPDGSISELTYSVTYSARLV